MIPDIDEVLRKLLTDEIEIKGNEIDIKFDQPRREWSSRVGKPTINLFLFDIRENLRLRGAEQYRTVSRPDGNSEVRRNPVRLDLRYLLTAWVKEPEDEHLLLATALIALLKNPFIPNKYLTENLANQPAPISLDVANFPPEKGPVDKFTEIWGVLDNELRPGILLTLTVAVDPYKPMTYKQVTSREMRFMVRDVIDPEDETAGTGVLSHEYYAVGGKITSSKHDLSTLTVLLVEQDQEFTLDEEGGFVLPSLSRGEYHLDIVYNDKVLKRHAVTIPADEIAIKV